jgi:cytochrome c55X
MPCRPPSALFAFAALALAAGAASAAEPAPARQKELTHLLIHDCGSCHGMTMKGGLGAPLTPASIADLPDETLIAIILDGIPGKPMPPWRGEISEDEALWLVRTLRKGPDHARLPAR